MAASFIEVDHGPDGRPARFERPAEVVVARGIEEVPAALAALDRALGQGAWVAGYATYELGYAFERRLAALLPPSRRLPLLEFGVFDAPGAAAPAAPGGELGPFAPAWDFAAYARAFERLAGMPGAAFISNEPALTFALDDECRTQCRVNVETRTNAYQIRTGEFHNEQVSVYVTARQYGSLPPDSTYVDVIDRLARLCRRPGLQPYPRRAGVRARPHRAGFTRGRAAAAGRWRHHGAEG